MKFITGLILAAMLMTGTGFSQDHYLVMNFGAGFPVGDFGDNGLDSKGYAGTGFIMSFEGNYFLNMIGFTGHLTYGMNFLDDVVLQEDLTRHLQELFPDVILPPDATTQFVTSQWSNVNALAGPVLSFPLSVIRIEMRALGGISFVMPPTWKLYIEAGDDRLHSESYGQSVKLAYLLGAGITYKTAGDYGLRLGVDYVGTKTDFSVSYVLDQGAAGNPYQTQNVEIPVNLFQVTLGITYAF